MWRVRDLLGRAVRSGVGDRTSEFSVDLRDLAPGVYRLEVDAGSQRRTQLFIRVR
jgi:hypothetical protein